nr:response regulator [Desulfobulbaceae bacterium]
MTNSILIVDDDLVGRTLLKGALDEYETALAEDGFTALKTISASHPDLILLDVNMPGMDGFEVCKKLKESPATAEIPIIFITGLSQTTDISRAFREGAVDFITKPFEISEVQARIKTHLTLKN